MQFYKNFNIKKSVMAKINAMPKTNKFPEVDYKLSFSFNDNYPKEISLETSSVLIGKTGNSSIYAVKAYPELESANKDIPVMKSYLVNSLMESEKNFDSLSGKTAVDWAKGLLSEHFGISSDSIVAKAVAYDVLGYGPISFLLENEENIEEIVINGNSSNLSIYHSRYGFCTTNLKFESEQAAKHAINKMIEACNKELVQETPIIDASLNSGIRIHAQEPPYSASGVIASIRLAKKERMGLRFLLKSETINPEIFAYLWMAMDAKLNILITGPPAAGKTTLLKALAEALPRYERIVAIEEETDELIMHSNFSNSVYLVGKKPGAENNLGLSEQVINALRLRPDRIILGEIRGSEAKDAFFGSNTGVPFMATLHVSGSGINVISRLESKPMLVDHALVQNLDVAVSMSLDSAFHRRVSDISEYFWLPRAELPLESAKELEITKLFSNGGITKETLRDSKVIKYFAIRRLISPSEAMKEFSKRSKFVSTFLNSNYPDFSEYAINYLGF